MNSKSELFDPASVERKIFAAVWDDGLLDCVVGLGLVLIGILWTIELVALTVLVPVLLLPLWLTARNRIAIPRAGFVRFGTERNRRTHQMVVITSIVGYGLLMAFGALYVFVVQSDSDVSWMETVVIGVPTIAVAAVLVVSRLALDMPIRTLAYAAVVLTVALTGIAFRLNPATQFLAIGVILLAVGSVLLARFLDKNRLSDVSDMQGSDE